MEYGFDNGFHNNFPFGLMFGVRLFGTGTKYFYYQYLPLYIATAQLATLIKPN
jgi:hypothetical protein